VKFTLIGRSIGQNVHHRLPKKGAKRGLPDVWTCIPGQLEGNRSGKPCPVACP